MELILISDSKLKIMLSSDDMRDYDIDCDSVDYSDTGTRRAFWTILDQAKRQTGFDAASERIYIQLYPSREGGCEMYVTKIGNPDDRHSTSLSLAAEHTLAFSFDSLDSLLRVCRQLSASGFSGSSQAFVDENGQTFLFVAGVRGSGVPDNLAFVSEFGELCDTLTLTAYATEHSTCICTTQAVQTLSAF